MQFFYDQESNLITSYQNAVVLTGKKFFITSII
jgi:hypothetical protein